MLTARNISKRFGRVLALDRVDFDARPGEIHALLGENGAGKTTLMNVLAGRIRPDGGEAMLDGAALRAGSAHAALGAGIAAVNQSPMLFERMTWEENLALGGFAVAGVDLDAVAARAGAIADRLGFKLPPRHSTVEQQSLGDRVRLEVLRALSFDPKVLILDEPTSVLGPAELGPFLDLLRRLRAGGRIIVLITHKLGEALAVADRITVLRHGRVAATTIPAETSETALARVMIGELAREPEASETPARPGEALLTIRELSLERGGRRVLDRVSLRLHAGEIAGIAGVDGNGQTDLVEILAGVREPTEGRIRLLDGAGAPKSALAVIPENRDLDGLVLDMQLWENLLLARALRKRVTRRGWLDRGRALELCRELLARFRIRAPGPQTAAGALSGGNRQRLEVARALGGNPRVIVAHNICRGLDLAASAEVHRTLLGFAASGGAVLLVSSDLDELLRLCRRLFVISGGRLRETAVQERDPERLGLLMAGEWE
ncbi:MAG TPA: ATP-binding cassette domain-containing protein [Candidatus Binataceae bacterium]|nr:ATP-binding cassette domain-containing protein [Candidatus Binataceae bacterium]